jgi:hypothetical protein
MSTFVSNFSETGASRAELRKAAADDGMTSSGAFSRALNDLLRRGALINHGTDQRPFYRTPDTGEAL